MFVRTKFFIFFIMMVLSLGLVVTSYAHEPHRINCPSAIDVQPINLPTGFANYYTVGFARASVRRSLISSSQLICRYNHPSINITWRLRSAVSSCTSNGNYQYTCVDGQNIHPTVTVTCPSTISEQATNLSGSWQTTGTVNVSITSSGANTNTANDTVYCGFGEGTTPSIEIRKSVPSRHICTARANGFDCKVR